MPSRVTEIKKDDLMATAGDGAGAKARGLLKRAENLYSDLPRHHETLRGELDRDRAELDDLLANPPGPFEHTGELTDKQAELASLTLELRMAAENTKPPLNRQGRLDVGGANCQRHASAPPIEQGKPR